MNTIIVNLNKYGLKIRIKLYYITIITTYIIKKQYLLSV